MSSVKPKTLCWLQLWGLRWYADILLILLLILSSYTFKPYRSKAQRRHVIREPTIWGCSEENVLRVLEIRGSRGDLPGLPPRHDIYVFFNCSAFFQNWSFDVELIPQGTASGDTS